MKRFFEKDLQGWKEAKSRKPLVVYGARQVGKTTTIRKFAQDNYSSAIEINFVERPDLKQAFQGSLEPTDVFKNIQGLLNVEIEPNSCLFLDEIQECEQAISALKFLNSNSQGVDVIAAGSTLGTYIARSSSFPVGNVTIKKMRPMNFEEFCLALGQDKAFDVVKSAFKKKSFCAVHDKMIDLWRMYLIVGGMPEAVKQFAQTDKLENVYKIQDDINTAYIADMAKYIQNIDATKVLDCWRSIPTQLAKENGSTKFAWKNVAGSASKRSHETALDWLINAGMLNRLNLVTDGVRPLASFENRDAFKIYLADTGLLCRMYRATIDDFSLKDMRSARFRGGVVENFVMQEFAANDIHAYYWGTKSKHEVDFVLSANSGVTAVEVKSGTHINASSAKYFANKYSCSQVIKLSCKNFGEATNKSPQESPEQTPIVSIPIYAAGLICAD